MKSLVVCLVLVAATVAADFAEYVPRAVYTIDEFGRQSPIIPVNSIPEALMRARRQAPGFPTIGGLPDYAGAAASGQLGGGFAFPQFPIGAPGTNYQGISTSVTSGGGIGSSVLENRFGESSAGGTGGSVTTVCTTPGGCQTFQGPAGGGVSISTVSGTGGLESRFGESGGSTGGTVSTVCTTPGGCKTYHSGNPGAVGGGASVSSVSGGSTGAGLQSRFGESSTSGSGTGGSVSTVCTSPGGCNTYTSGTPGVAAYQSSTSGGTYPGTAGYSSISSSTGNLAGGSLESRFGADGAGGAAFAGASGGAGAFPGGFGFGSIPGFGPGFMSGFGAGFGAGFPIPAGGQGISTSVSSTSGGTDGLASRFGESSPSGGTHSVTSVTGSDGKVTTHTTHVRPDGTVYTHKDEKYRY